MTDSKARPIYQVALEIKRNWKNVNYAAAPYLRELARIDHIDSPDPDTGFQAARSIVRGFLGNAGAFRGPDAKRLKAELKAML